MSISVEGISKTFKGRKKGEEDNIVLNDVSFQVEEGEFVSLLGPSGCGKTTTLTIIAGFQKPNAGKIVVNGKEVTKPGPDRSFMFQNYALFPTMTVEQNVGAGLAGDKKKKQEQVQKMIRHFRLEGLEKRLPRELSGGQQQRVALARIMAYEPSVILLDEPFSALDVFLKDRLQQEMMELLSDYDGTVILVSHSRDEIYRFSEELLVIDDGKQICYGDTKAIFDCPEQVEAARLTGCKNIVQVKRLDEHSIEIPDWGTRLHLEQEIDAEITHIGLRAHEFIPVWGEREDNCIPVKEKGKAEFPFEWKYFLKGETEESDDICWYVQKNLWDELTEKGIPDYLKLPEKEILLLK